MARRQTSHRPSPRGGTRRNQPGFLIAITIFSVLSAGICLYMLFQEKNKPAPATNLVARAQELAKKNPDAEALMPDDQPVRVKKKP